MPTRAKAERMQNPESAELPKFKSPLIARLTADMMRQHSRLYLQHAAVLERLAQDPSSPEQWMLEEESPERIAARLQQEETTTLAVKSYEGMLQVQKRVDHMERLMTRNGMSKHAILASRKTKPNKRATAKDDPTSAFYWFFKENSVRISQDLQEAVTSKPVRTEIQRLWKLHNALERRPYIAKAERVASLKASTTTAVTTSSSGEVPPKKQPAVAVSNNNKTAKSSAKTRKKVGNDDGSDSDSSSSSSSSSDGSSSDEEGLLFQRKEKSTAAAKQKTSQDDDSDDDDDIYMDS